MGYFRSPALICSIAFHILLLSGLFLYSSKLSRKQIPKSEITILLHPDPSHSEKSSRARSASGPNGSRMARLKGQPATPHHSFDLRPGFAKNFGKTPGVSPSPDGGTSSNSDAQELLHVDGRSLQAFDQLALVINGHLDYPAMLAENGVHGMATLDLYFDHDAHIDESRSRMLGDNRWIRGLFVKAARIGLEDWFRGMGGSLNKAQFRDQHFRADFVITYTNTHASDLEKNGESNYHMVRRQLVQTCLNPAAGGLDLACTAMRVAGVISSKVSSNYKIKFQALKDRLEQYDETGLSGINQSILRRSET
jgi:hypothetical protein